MPKVKSGKETVKFLANFDYLIKVELVRPFSHGGRFSLSPRERDGVRGRYRSPAHMGRLAVGALICCLPFPPQNFLARPYDCAIVPRILGNWILNEMDNHGT